MPLTNLLIVGYFNRDKKEVVWFDDVDEILLDIATSNTVADAKQLDASSALVKVDSYDG